MAHANPPHTGTPLAEIPISVELARGLLARQHPDLADLTITLLAEGWDNAVFRLGGELTLRLPRRAVGADLIRHEQRWLPLLKGRLPLAIPAPVRIGIAQDGYPWPWSVTPWFGGETADLALPNDDQGQVLGDFFRALHKPAPDDAPRNQGRGVPLTSRLPAYAARIKNLADKGVALDPAVLDIWADALAAPNDAAPTWIQGDPHPRNVIVRDGCLAAVIDWGDVGQGDRASDLAAVWMVLPSARARQLAMESCGEVTEATWRRARGWAVHYGVMLLDAGLTDDPRMAAIARSTFARLIEDRAA